MNIDEVLTAYLECAVWSSSYWPEDGEPIPLRDAGYDVSDIPTDVVDEMKQEVHEFVLCNLQDIEAAGLAAGQVGHDFWLTRNGHGAGFWDRGLGAVGDRLSDAAKAYGECDLQTDDGGKLFI